jgi:hypothetical protein
MLEGRRVSALVITLGERRYKSRRTSGAEGDLVLSELIGLLLRYPLTKRNDFDSRVRQTVARR